MLTAFAFRLKRVVFAIVCGLMLTGAIAYFTLPALEDPPITIREAIVTVQYPGLPPERMEQLVTRPVEQAARGLAEADAIVSSSLPGLSIVHVEVGEQYGELDQIWDDLRDEIESVVLPAGAFSPSVVDDVGDVSVVTLALTGAGYDMGTLGEMAGNVRDRLYGVGGVKRIVLSGDVPERIEIEVDEARLAALGLGPDAVARMLAAQNVVTPGGSIDTGARVLLIEPTGDFVDLDTLREALIPAPDGRTVPLRDVATVTRTLLASPPERAYYADRPAVILAISMLEGERVLEFGPRMREAITEVEARLPVGMQLETVTFQADQVGRAVFGVTANVGQTILLVCGVVVLLLGLRTGLIVGAIVPTVMLATIALFSLFGVAIERMSLATLVIALGLFVDNGIVVGEDFRRRLADGKTRDEALEGVGRELALPLLASTATTILVFLPLMLAQSSAGEYTRSISIVVAISLTLSWAMSMTLTPILCHRFLKDPDPNAKRPLNERAFDPLKRGYRGLLRAALAHKLVFCLGTVAALGMGMFGMATAPQKFFPDSDRTQVIVYADLPPGTSADRTDAVMRGAIADLIARDPEWLESVATYVGYGGPRFVLSLTPVDPAPNRAVMIVNVAGGERMDAAQADLRRFFEEEVPDVRATVARMFLGPSDSNVLEVQVRGPDATYLMEQADAVAAIMADVPGAHGISHDWEGRVPRLVVEVDQARAREAGVTSDSVARALARSVSGAPVSEYRDGDDVIPILLRGAGAARTDPGAIETLPVPVARGGTVPLGQVADVTVVNGFGRIEREALTRAVTVEGRSTGYSAEGMVPLIADQLAALEDAMAPGHSVEIVGVVQDSAEGASSLQKNMPLCFALIFLLLIAQFNSFRRAGIVMMTLPLVIVGVALGIHVMGADFGFMPILGILSLFGIILNNGIVLIDRIDVERAEGTPVAEAILEASVRRLRPILMTTVTTVLGLLPLILSRDALFYGFASVVAWGLMVGTVLTLGVVPVLYGAFLGREDADGKASGNDVDETACQPSAEVAVPHEPEYLLAAE